MQRTATNTKRQDEGLDPFPDGWYVIELSSRLPAGKLLEKRWMGHDIVAWRDDGGGVCVANAVCPHLGSSLGAAAGGVLRNGRLVCPFHGFEYDVSGACVATPAGPPPRSARLSRFEVHEVNGYIFAWHHRDGRAPWWRLEDVSPAGVPRAVAVLRVRAHPQTTSENSVDSAHLGHLHGYRELRQTAPTEIDGGKLAAFYAFSRNMLTAGLRRVELSVEIAIALWGLGVSTVEIRTRGLMVRQWVLTTPVDGDIVDIWLGMDIEKFGGYPWLVGPLRRLGTWIAARLMLHELVLEVRKDAEVWARQDYRPQPVLSGADRDIRRFRRYCEQFYAPGLVPAVEVETGGPAPPAG